MFGLCLGLMKALRADRPGLQVETVPARIESRDEPAVMAP